MDIRLRTNTDNTTFKLLDCRALDEDHFECFLVVRSGPFQAHTSFWFDRTSLLLVAECLKNTDRPFDGECRLSYPDEKQFIAFKGNGRGYATVFGLLAQNGTQCQCLRFELPVNAAYLGPLAAELEALAADEAFRQSPETAGILPPGSRFRTDPDESAPGSPQSGQTGDDCGRQAGDKALAD